MKPFRVQSLEEQKQRYFAALRGNYDKERRELIIEHEDAFDKARELHERATKLSSKIDHVSNTVANRADRTYGGGEVWRRSPRLLRKVVAEMNAATEKYEIRRAALLKREKNVLAPYNAALDKIERRMERLRKTA